jgi:hypothetical protein
MMTASTPSDPSRTPAYLVRIPIDPRLLPAIFFAPFFVLLSEIRCLGWLHENEVASWDPFGQDRAHDTSTGPELMFYDIPS